MSLFTKQKKHRKSRFLIKHFYVYKLKKDFKKGTGYDLNLEHPKTYNEKLQWLKCYYRDPMMTQCADKIAVRDIVRNLIGDQYIIPLYGTWKRPEDIDFESLPNEFVLKTNHTSSKVILCPDKSKLNKEECCEKLTQWLSENYYYMAGEWVYRDIPPKILCERFLHGEMIDYKFHCFHGEPKICEIITNRKNGHLNGTLFDMDFQRLPVVHKDPIDEHVKKPEHFEEMIRIARTLSARFPFVRVDLYDLEGQVWFGELTFFPSNGMEWFNPPEWDRKLGDMIHLDQLNPAYVKDHIE